MGKSAKVHKRAKKTASSSPTVQPKTAVSSAPSGPVRSARKRAGLKSKAGARPGGKGGQDKHVLGGADYVTLLLGGRRKAAEETLKLGQLT